MRTLPTLPQLLGTILFYGITFVVLLCLSLVGSYAVALVLARILTGSAC